MDKTPLEVVSDNKGVTGLKVKDNATGAEEVIETDGVFVAIGHKPNTGFLYGRNRLRESSWSTRRHRKSCIVSFATFKSSLRLISG
ncbi:thioredoxin reductase [Paenibacillus sp. V4I3]|nr:MULTISPECIES: hypothetical protein [unclassified Paenibacillus]MDQ0878713.1 thioredoxin reductase [Paenibacillus sp. V4I3]MDQ0885431.1 thioredoxin reductase [Paenibacillus sp. V4I9]